MNKLILIFVILCIIKCSIQRQSCSCPKRRKHIVQLDGQLKMAYPVIRYIPCVLTEHYVRINYMVVCLEDKFVEKYVNKKSKSLRRRNVLSAIKKYVSVWNRQSVDKYIIRNQNDRDTLFDIKPNITKVYRTRLLL